ncbi:ACT domain-containing protein [Methanosalsum natronophilum]|uniref:UPF0237 protein D5R95_05925 n=1 Tax=Methanosalsum natronophilum TaxID=768733 RepID=A0A424YWL7_9EURY|nr:ACT domain-containing protein [Methanosalsum natronophilum]MCS3924159.1 ACT domain-containing protein [Methanosalsum natronophilum]RQD84119.1 MAG: ACT domain-containing protein [Methanosalsum natronophilum]
MTSNRYVITVIGTDKVGIVASITKVMADFNVNIIDISQTIMEDIFTMTMFAENINDDFDLLAFQKKMNYEGERLGVEVKVQNEDVFKYMHRI